VILVVCDASSQTLSPDILVGVNVVVNFGVVKKLLATFDITPPVRLMELYTWRVLVVAELAARELTKIVAALRDVVEPVKAVAATVDVCDVRPATVDVREAVEMYPAVPRPCVVDVRERVEMNPAVPRP
jgi:hypothetical protein